MTSRHLKVNDLIQGARILSFFMAKRPCGKNEKWVKGRCACGRLFERRACDMVRYKHVFCAVDCPLQVQQARNTLKRALRTPAINERRIQRAKENHPSKKAKKPTAPLAAVPLVIQEVVVVWAGTSHKFKGPFQTELKDGTLTLLE